MRIVITRFQRSKSDKIGLGVALFILFAFVALVPALLVFTKRPIGYAEVLIVLSGFGLTGYLVFSQFIRGRIHETYLLSSRTLAIVRPGARARYIKPQDIAAFKIASRILIMSNGKPMHLQNVSGTPGRIEPADSVITQWFGPEILEDACASRFPDRVPQGWILTVVLVLVCPMIVATYHFTITGRWLLSVVIVAVIHCVILPFAIVLFLAAIYSSEKKTYPVRRTAAPKSTLDPARAKVRSPIKRFPAQRPSIFEHVAPSVSIMLLIALAFPATGFLFSYEMVAMSPWLVLMVLTVDACLAIAYYVYHINRLLVQRELFVTVLVSTRSMAIVHPRKGVRYIAPARCVGFKPNANVLLLDDGRQISLKIPGARTTADALPYVAIRRQWWPAAPDGKPDMNQPMKWNLNTTQTVTVAGLFLLGVGALGLEALLPRFGFPLVALHFWLGSLLYGVFRAEQNSARIIPLNEVGNDPRPGS